jgi:peptidoglycan/xylan/chitin deacetylase (PgdA/CDA1 family)
MNLWILGGAAVAAAGLSARWNWWRPAVGGIPILMYHKVGQVPAGSKLAKLWVSTEMFRNQMAYLNGGGWQPITFKDLYSHWDKQTPLPAKPVLITFDDGYQNNYTEAFPVLRDFGFRATLYVVVQTVGWDNRWHNPATETRVPMISWAQLKELQKAGWEIGSHTMNHPNLKNIELKEMKIEVAKSRSVLAEFMEETPDSFAYPYGAGEDVPAVVQAVKEAGYRTAVTVHAGKWKVDRFVERPFHLPRVFVRGDDNMFDFHLHLTRGRSRF